MWVRRTRTKLSLNFIQHSVCFPRELLRGAWGSLHWWINRLTCNAALTTTLLLCSLHLRCGDLVRHHQLAVAARRGTQDLRFRKGSKEFNVCQIVVITRAFLLFVLFSERERERERERLSLLSKAFCTFPSQGYYLPHPQSPASATSWSPNNSFTSFFPVLSGRSCRGYSVMWLTRMFPPPFPSVACYLAYKVHTASYLMRFFTRWKPGFEFLPSLVAWWEM